MIILDSSFLVSVEVETDQNHERAVEIRNKIIKGDFGELFISDYIFDETVTVTFNKTKDLNKAVEVGEILMGLTEILKVEEKTLEETWKIFKNQKKTMFSFTDCTILALMQEKGIKNLATFDEDFDKIEDINVIH